MLPTVTRARQWSLGAIGAAAAALGPTGCYEGFDPLDPEVLAEVARSRGDARGYDRSGVYAGTFEVHECGCGEVDSRFDVSLCTTIERLEALGLPPVLELELVQADGTVRIEALGLGDFFEEQALLLPVFYGPLHADGRIAAAGVLQADAIAVQGQVLGRIDGTLGHDDETDAWALVAEYQQRYAVDFITAPDVLDIGIEGDSLSIDCRERIGLDLRWASPPLAPIDGI